jgi:hypothetical protein
MYQPRTQTITRRTIKRVETRLTGLGRLSGFSIPLPTQPPASSPPINPTSTNSSISFEQFWNLLTGRVGELKIEATQFVEGMVRIMYGLEGDCSMPQPGIPIVPNNTSPRFCAASIAGMIERCRLTEAQSALNAMSSEFQSRMNNPNDPIAPYIKRWWDDYGRNDLSGLTTKISSARGTCGVTGDIPKLCTAPMIWSATQFKCVYPTEGGTSGGTTTIMMVAAFAVLAMFMMKR